MSKRITQKMLESLCSEINNKLDRNKSPWRMEHGVLYANIGNLHIDYAYGGVSLVEMVNENGGVRCIFGSGHVTKRELWNKMQAFILGLNY